MAYKWRGYSDLRCNSPVSYSLSWKLKFFFPFFSISFLRTNKSMSRCEGSSSGSHIGIRTPLERLRWSMVRRMKGSPSKESTGQNMDQGHKQPIHARPRNNYPLGKNSTAETGIETETSCSAGINEQSFLYINILTNYIYFNAIRNILYF